MSEYVIPATGENVAMNSGAASDSTQRLVTASDSPEVTSLAIIDDWDESDRAKVNPVVGQAGVAAGAGSVAANVQRVTLASDDPAVTDLAAIEVLLTGIDADTNAIKTAVEALDNAITGSEMQVDVVASLPAGDNNIGNVDLASAIPAGTNNIGDVDIATITAGETHIGEVGGNSSVFAVTFSLDTSAYATGDVLADTQVMTSCLRKTDGTGVLNTIVLNDKDDQGIALDVVILSANVALGTENAAVSISDTNADSILAIVQVASSDWIDLGGCRVATLRNLGIPVMAASGTSDLYVGLITRGSPTHTASGITGRFGFLRD